MSQVRKELVAMIDAALGQDPKAALIAARRLQDEVAWLTKRSVAIARADGYDWGRIGRLLGISRQGARQKFPCAPPTPSPHTLRMQRYLKPIRDGERLLEQLKNQTAGRTQEPDDPVFW